MEYDRVDRGRSFCGVRARGNCRYGWVPGKSSRGPRDGWRPGPDACVWTLRWVSPRALRRPFSPLPPARPSRRQDLAAAWQVVRPPLSRVSPWPLTVAVRSPGFAEANASGYTGPSRLVGAAPTPPPGPSWNPLRRQVAAPASAADGFVVGCLSPKERLRRVAPSSPCRSGGRSSTSATPA